jgi:hypothetical protein
VKGEILIGVYVTFDYDGNFERSRVLKIAENARSTFEGMPNLRFKFFTFDEERQRATNFYVWDSKGAAESFFSPELRERVRVHPLSLGKSLPSATFRPMVLLLSCRCSCAAHLGVGTAIPLRRKAFR